MAEIYQEALKRKYLHVLEWLLVQGYQPPIQPKDLNHLFTADSSVVIFPPVPGAEEPTEGPEAPLSVSGPALYLDRLTAMKNQNKIEKTQTGLTFLFFISEER